jgi:hypothetical protein
MYIYVCTYVCLHTQKHEFLTSFEAVVPHLDTLFCNLVLRLTYAVVRQKNHFSWKQSFTCYHISVFLYVWGSWYTCLSIISLTGQCEVRSLCTSSVLPQLAMYVSSRGRFLKNELRRSSKFQRSPTCVG